jgi:hypothetical protein
MLCAYRIVAGGSCDIPHFFCCGGASRCVDRTGSGARWAAYTVAGAHHEPLTCLAPHITGRDRVYVPVLSLPVPVCPSRALPAST